MITMKKRCPNKVIVIGDNHVNTLGLLRSLGKCGYHPILVEITNKNNFNLLAHCRYVSQQHIVETPEEGIDFILSKFGDETIKPVIIPMSDRIAKTIDNRYSLLSDRFIVSSVKAEQGELSNLLSKDEMRKIANECGLLTPPSWVVNWNDKRDLPHDIKYPCIIKAISSSIGRKDLNIYHTDKQLIDGLNALSEESSVIQIQQYLKKDFEILYNGYSLGTGRHAISCVILKKRQYPWEIGGFAYGQVSRDIGKYIPIDKLNRFLDTIDYNGIFSIEFMYAQNEFFFLEINLRNDATSYLSTIGGINLPDRWIQANLSQRIPDCNLISRTFYGSNALKDMENARNGYITWFSWLKDLLRIKGDTFYSFKDPMPNILYWLNAIKTKIHRFI